MTDIIVKSIGKDILLTNKDGISKEVTDFNPSDLLAGALAKCTRYEVRKFANKKEYPLDDVVVQVELNRNRESKTTLFNVHLHLYGDLSEGQRKKLLKVSRKSYISRLLSNKITLEGEYHYHERKEGSGNMDSKLENRNLTTTSEISAINIIHDTDENKFILPLGDDQAFIDYTEKDGQLLLTHSEVPHRLRGQGVGKILVKKTFDFLQTNQIKAKPICSYIRAMVKRSHQWQDVLNP